MLSLRWIVGVYWLLWGLEWMVILFWEQFWVCSVFAVLYFKYQIIIYYIIYFPVYDADSQVYRSRSLLEVGKPFRWGFVSWSCLFLGKYYRLLYVVPFRVELVLPTYKCSAKALFLVACVRFGVCSRGGLTSPVGFVSLLTRRPSALHCVSRSILFVCVIGRGKQLALHVTDSLITCN